MPVLPQVKTLGVYIDRGLTYARAMANSPEILGGEPVPALSGPFHILLRERTAQCHRRVDDAYASFRLDDRRSYADFLSAHASVLVPIELWIDAGALVAGWHGRTAALTHDLAALDRAPPEPIMIDWPAEDGARWGALYVVEGSRLGGRFLARSVPPELPSAYLSSMHAPGGWRAMLAAIDEAAASSDHGWQEAALASAERVFAAYQAAARAWIDHG